MSRMRKGRSAKRRLLVGTIFIILLITFAVSTALSSAGITATWESDALSLQLDAKMVFPRGSAAVLDHASFNLYENGNSLGDVKVETFAPSAGQTFLVTTKVRFPYSSILTMIGSYSTHAGSVIWRIAGDASFNTVVGVVDLPTDITTIPSAPDFYPAFFLTVLLVYIALAFLAYRKGYI